jgi:TolB-like protein
MALVKPLEADLKKIDVPIYVTDFVNLEELENHSELGFLLSDELKTQASQHVGIYAVEYAKHMKIGANGTKLFTRDLNEIKNVKIDQNSYALVGTYAFTQRQLILYTKLIRLKDGVIIRSSTKATSLTDEIIHLEQKVKPPVKKDPNPNGVYQPMVL